MLYHAATIEEESQSFLVSLLEALVHKRDYNNDFVNRIINSTKAFKSKGITVYQIDNDIYRYVIMLSKLDDSLLFNTDLLVVYNNIANELSKTKRYY